MRYLQVSLHGGFLSNLYRDNVLTLKHLVFKDLATHDLDWVNYFIDTRAGIDYCTIDYQLSLGLARVRSLVEAKTNAERRRILADPINKSRYYSFIGDGLRDAVPSGRADSLERLSPVERARVMRDEWFKDPDNGPELAWIWAHRPELSSAFILSHGQVNLRQWGYVMWDMLRLDKSGMFEKRYEIPELDDYFRAVGAPRVYRETGFLLQRQRELTQKNN